MSYARRDPLGAPPRASRPPFAASLYAPVPSPPAADAWAAVRIETVSVQSPPRAADAAARSVLACVYLGRLLPADVEVHLVRAAAAADDLPARGSVVRLWSRHPYGNGAYLFEGQVPAALLDADRLELHVAPRGVEVLPFTPPVGIRRRLPRAD